MESIIGNRSRDYILPTSTDTELATGPFKHLAEPSASVPAILSASKKPMETIVEQMLANNPQMLERHYINVGDGERITLLYDREFNQYQLAGHSLCHLCRFLDPGVPPEQRLRCFQSYVRTVVTIANHCFPDATVNMGDLYDLVKEVKRFRRRHGEFQLDYARLAKVTNMILFKQELSPEDQVFYKEFIDSCKFINL